MSRAIAVMDIEVRTPVGLTAPTAAAAVRADISRISGHPFMLDPAGEPVRGARDGRLDPEIFGARRLATLAGDPLERLCDRLPPELGRRLSVILAMPEPRPGWQPADAAHVLAFINDLVNRRFPGTRVTATVAGHAGGLHAFHAAAAVLQTGAADVCLIGAVDSYYHPDTIDWLYAEKRAATADVRSGFLPGEAAGFVALAGTDTLRRARIEPRATVVGVGVATEKVILSSAEECLGAGLSAAVHAATAPLGTAEPIERVICDINGERYRSQEWGMAILKAWKPFQDPTKYEAPASAWGDVGAASGPLFATLAVQGWARGYAPGRRALLFAGSDAGARAVVVLEQPEPGRRS